MNNYDLNLEIKKSNRSVVNIINDAIDLILQENQTSKLTSNDRQEVVNTVETCVRYRVLNPIKKRKKIEQEKISAEERSVKYLALKLNSLILQKTNPIINRKAPKLSERNVVKDEALPHFLYHLYKITQPQDISYSKIQEYEKNHDLLMAIENLQGHLLESYIASKVCNNTYSIIWLDGEIVKAADFAYEHKSISGQSKLHLLQIKNKYNTENSSSSAIRNGTTIKKWCRLKKRTVNKEVVPKYEWDSLNQIIKDFSGVAVAFSEDDYRNYLVNVIKNNPDILRM